MKLDPDPMPSRPGIYALAHRGTSSVYIAFTPDLKNRAYQWRHALAHDHPAQRPQGFPRYPSEMWTFKCITFWDEHPDHAKYSVIKAMENAQARGLTVLNNRKPKIENTTPFDRRAHQLQQMLVTIVDDNNKPMTYNEAIVFLYGELGRRISPQHIRKMVKAYAAAYPNEKRVHFKNLKMFA